MPGCSRPSRERHCREVQQLRRRLIPFVMVDGDAPEDIPSVNVDDCGGARAAMALVLAHGHRRIGVLCLESWHGRPEDYTGTLAALSGIMTAGLLATSATNAGVGTGATYCDNVRVPADNLIGGRGGGWALITNQLNRERVALTSSAPLVHSIELVTNWARETKNANGVRVIDQEWVQILLGRAQARTDALTLMGWKLAAEIDTLSPADASAIKVYGSELAVEVYRALKEIVGPASLIAADSPGAVIAGRLERYFRSSLVMTFGGGTNEIQRDIIGYVGLGMPAAKR